MKIGFYADASKLIDFSIEKFTSGELGLSGTDASFYRVVKGLSSRGWDVHLFAKGINSFPEVKLIKIKKIEEAVKLTKDLSLDFLIFNDLKNIELTTRAIFLAEQLSVSILIWAHNPVQTLKLYNKSKSIKRIIYVENFDLNQIRQHAAFYKGIVIPNGIEESVYANNEISIPNNQNVFFLGALTETKGFHHLAKAWPKILKEVPLARLQILGSGKLYDNHINLGSLGIAEENYEKVLKPFLGKSKAELKRNNVEAFGLLNRNELIKIMTAAKVACINPNTDGSLESCSVSSLEIQMCGVPIIAGRAGGNLNTIKHNQTGILIKNVDRELPRAIIKLLTEDQVNLKMRIQARNYVLSKYELSNVLDKWEDFLWKLNEGYTFPILPVTPELRSYKTYLKEGMRLANKIISLRSN